MTIFLTVLSILLSLIALLLIAGLFIKKEYDIVRSIIIAQPQQKTFDYIRLLKNQDQYNKWWSVDPHAKKTFTGTDGTVRFIAAWDSTNNQVGKGEQEIKRITGSERIDFEIRFERPFQGVADTFMATNEVPGGTKVTWGFSGKNKYPMNLIYKLFNLEKKLGNDISESLHRLKQAVK